MGWYCRHLCNVKAVSEFQHRSHPSIAIFKILESQDFRFHEIFNDKTSYRQLKCISRGPCDITWGFISIITHLCYFQQRLGSICFSGFAHECSISLANSLELSQSCTKPSICSNFRKDSKYLGENWQKGVPIEVIPLAYQPVINKLHSMLGGKAVLRMAKNKAVRMLVYGFILSGIFIIYYWKNILHFKHVTHAEYSLCCYDKNNALFLQVMKTIAYQ